MKELNEELDEIVETGKAIAQTFNEGKHDDKGIETTLLSTSITFTT